MKVVVKLNRDGFGAFASIVRQVYEHIISHRHTPGYLPRNYWTIGNQYFKLTPSILLRWSEYPPKKVYAYQMTTDLALALWDYLSVLDYLNFQHQEFYSALHKGLTDGWFTPESLNINTLPQ